MVSVTCGTDVACESCPVNLLAEGAERAMCGDAVRFLTEAGIRNPTNSEARVALGNAVVGGEENSTERLTRATRAGAVVAFSELCRRRFIN